MKPKIMFRFNFAAFSAIFDTFNSSGGIFTHCLFPFPVHLILPILMGIDDEMSRKKLASCPERYVVGMMS